jgi:hypothetical protein
VLLILIIIAKAVETWVNKELNRDQNTFKEEYSVYVEYLTGNALSRKQGVLTTHKIEEYKSIKGLINYSPQNKIYLPPSAVKMKDSRMKGGGLVR